MGRKINRHKSNDNVSLGFSNLESNKNSASSSNYHNESLLGFNPNKLSENPSINSDLGVRGFANASPSIRKLARELGVNLDNVTGTGKHGRIIESDVKNYVNTTIANNLIPANSINNKDIDFSKWGKVTEKSLPRIKKKSGLHLHKNWLSIPHVTHFAKADITELEQFRNTQQRSALAKDLKITLLIFLIQAIIKALKKYPNFNSSLNASGDSLIIKDYYNIGIAVDTQHGLVVPVIKQADNFADIFKLAIELYSISQKARDNKLTVEDMSGGCFTISSLGGIGGCGFTPIINAPEVAILGVARHELTPIYLDKELQPRLILPLALSYDHRVIDGAEAAHFCKFIVEQLEDVKNFYA